MHINLWQIIKKIELLRDIMDNKIKEWYIMKIEVILNENIVVNDEEICKIVVTQDKNEKKEIKMMYSKRIMDTILAGLSQFYFLVEGVPEDKKTAKITSEALSEMLFDIGWEFKNNNIDDSNFKIIILAQNEETRRFYEVACDKMGLL